VRRSRRTAGLRGRLTAWIAGILLLALGATFIAVDTGTGRRLRAQIDAELRTEATTFAGAIAPGNAARADEILTVARDYVANLRFSERQRLLIASVPGGRYATSQVELLDPRNDGRHEPTALRRERADARALRSIRSGFRTLDLADVGSIRLFTVAVRRRGQRVATVTVGEPTTTVDRAQRGIERTFLLAGSLAMLAALVAGYIVAARTTGPLRRMARVAADVDAGDLSHRIGARGPRDEVRVLADAFDRMLDRLEDAFSRQRAFVADASHELRTPLTVIRGQIEVLARQREPSAQDVGHVERAVRTEIARMERLVEELMLLARLDEGMALQPRALELAPFLTEIVDAATLTGERRFELGEVPAGVLRADPDRIAQVLRNLIGNAVEHTQPGGLVRLTTTTSGGRVTFVVEDDGPGIPPDQLDRVFDRFHRTDAARDRRAGGSGLGLAIAQALVAAHGGRIWAAASPAGGARLAFELPGFAPAPGQPAPRARRAAPGTPPAPPAPA